MKKIVASVGLVALGASGIQTVSAQTVASPDTTKMWSVGLTLRGFYDDNPGTVPNGVAIPPGYHKESAGFEVSPQAALNWALEQTTINLGVLYSLKYYENKPPGSTGHDDQVFTFNAGVSHSFNENLKGRVSDSFVIGQEPDLLRAGNTFSTFQRISGDNIRNYGSISLDDQLSPQFGVGLGYDNAFYDYANTGATTTPVEIAPGVFVPGIQPSYAGTLNRIEQRAHVEGLYTVQPETQALVGYQFTDLDYTGDEPISGIVGVPSTIQMSDVRNYFEHTFYVGAIHKFSPQFNGSLRAGASYTDYRNDPNMSSTWTPYVLGSLRYSYAPESYLEGGISYDRTATDVVGLQFNGANPVGVTTDAEAFSIYATLRHRLMPNLFANVTGQFQNNWFNGGSFNNDTEQYYLAGLEVEYKFNPWFSSHLGYNYDNLQSQIPFRSFDRNRVYVGITATY
jgi:hypothetical protein